MTALLLLLACAGPEHTPPSTPPVGAPTEGHPTPARGPGRPGAPGPGRPGEGPAGAAAERAPTSGMPAVGAPDPAALARARAKVPDAVAFAEQNGARAVSAGDTYALVWEPAGATRTIVSLHGHEGWAYEDLRAWLPHAKTVGARVVTVQWWDGEGDETRDYLTPEALYRAVDEGLKAAGARPGTVLLHGFSRGSTVTYAVAAMDTQNGRWLNGVVANAGGAHLDFPPTAAVDSGRYGARPFAGQAWTLFCGGKDPDPELNGCPAMRKTARWIEAKGATATLISDPAADHGGFHRNAANVRKALDGWVGG